MIFCQKEEGFLFCEVHQPVVIKLLAQSFTELRAVLRINSARFSEPINLKGANPR
jgi:hypothetical protein